MTAAFEASQRDLQETTERVEELRTNLARHQHTMQEGTTHLHHMHSCLVMVHTNADHLQYLNIKTFFF